MFFPTGFFNSSEDAFVPNLKGDKFVVVVLFSSLDGEGGGQEKDSKLTFDASGNKWQLVKNVLARLPTLLLASFIFGFFYVWGVRQR